MQERHTIKKDEMEILEEKIIDVQLKIQRADKLLDGLSGEKERWDEQKDVLEREMHSIVQDMMISSGIISYLGPYTQKYRAEIVKTWSNMMSDKMVPLSHSYSLVKCLGDPVDMKNWQMKDLPPDTFSTENGIIMF